MSAHCVLVDSCNFSPGDWDFVLQVPGGAQKVRAALLHGELSWKTSPERRAELDLWGTGTLCSLLSRDHGSRAVLHTVLRHVYSLGSDSWLQQWILEEGRVLTHGLRLRVVLDALCNHESGIPEPDQELLDFTKDYLAHGFGGDVEYYRSIQVGRSITDPAIREVYYCLVGGGADPREAQHASTELVESV